MAPDDVIELRGLRIAGIVGVLEHERVQPQPHRLLHQLGWRAGAVEEGEVAVAVQLGVGRDGHDGTPGGG